MSDALPTIVLFAILGFMAGRAVVAWWLYRRAEQENEAALQKLRKALSADWDKP